MLHNAKSYLLSVVRRSQGNDNFDMNVVQKAGKRLFFRCVLTRKIAALHCSDIASLGISLIRIIKYLKILPFEIFNARSTGQALRAVGLHKPQPAHQVTRITLHQKPLLQAMKGSPNISRPL